MEPEVTWRELVVKEAGLEAELKSIEEQLKPLYEVMEEYRPQLEQRSSIIQRLEENARGIQAAYEAMRISVIQKES